MPRLIKPVATLDNPNDYLKENNLPQLVDNGGFFQIQSHVTDAKNGAKVSEENSSEARRGDSSNQAGSKSKGRHICPYCGHGCAKPSVLEKHLRAHTNERPFPCEPCGFSFKTKSNLYKHCKSRSHAMNVSTANGPASAADGSENSISSSSYGSHSEDELSDCGSQSSKYQGKNNTGEVQMPSSIYGMTALNLMDSTLSGLTDLAVDAKQPQSPPRRSLKSKGAGLKLQIPSPNTSSGGWSSNGSSGSGASVRGMRSPKVTSPEQLELHISKIISENAAIVETFDSLWPRKYLRQSSAEYGKNEQSRASAVKLRRYSDNPSLHSNSGVSDDGETPKLGLQSDENPEGSIIKDLLLKVQISKTVDSNSNYINGPIEAVPTSSSTHVCQTCQVSFKKLKNLEIHQLYYCKKEEGLKIFTNDEDDEGRLLMADKRRKISDTGLLCPVKSDPQRRISFAGVTNDMLIKRQNNLQLFGGNVEINDSPTPKKLKLDSSGSHENLLPTPQSLSKSIAFPWLSPSDTSSVTTTSPFLVTIARPVLNSGGTVQVSSSESLRKQSVCIPVVALGGPLVSSRCSSPSAGSGTSAKVENYDTVILSSAPQKEVEEIGLSASHPSHFPFTLNYNDETQNRVPTVTVTPNSPIGSESDVAVGFVAPKRPNSLPLKKKAVTMKLVGTTLVSPETPRPKKRYGQLHLNGNAYTYLGLKRSTKSTWCCIYRPQPMYVPQATDHKLSMYSNWQAVSTKPEFHGLTPGKAMSLYDSHHLKRKFRPCISKMDAVCVVTHSSYWSFKKEQDKDQKFESDSSANKLEITREPIVDRTNPEMQSPCNAQLIQVPESSNTTTDISDLSRSCDMDLCDEPRPEDRFNLQLSKSESKRVRIFEGGYKSNEDYTYVRGRGRGKYVCEECGIRCKKPSMLRKHIKTHTNLRPFTCRHCTFSFKTKGNLTKHMKSKAHHKKCVEMGIVPVPTIIDSSQIDTDALAKQEELDRFGRHEDDDTEDDEEDMDEDDEDDESDCEKSSICSYSTSVNLSGGNTLVNLSSPKQSSPSGNKEQEVAKSLLSLRNHVYTSDCLPIGSTTMPEMTPPPNSISAEPCTLPKIHFCLKEGADNRESHTNGTPHNYENLRTNEAMLARQRSISETESSNFLQDKQRKYSFSQSEALKHDQPMDLSLSKETSCIAQKEAVPKPNYTPVISSITPSVKLCSLPSKKRSVMLSYEKVKVTESGSSQQDKEGDDQHDDDGGAPLPSFSAMTSYTNSLGEEGKCMCQICHKVFAKPSQLRLHINIHYIERPFRCESCAISFRTKGHLEKHKRSLSHYNKVNMNMTFGIPTTENPRPFKCSDCKIAFRIHGHLAKHLRSKLHIMKLECLGKLPFGTYAEMERSGTNLNEIDTSDCDNSLESLQLMAQKIYNKEDSSKEKTEKAINIVHNGTEDSIEGARDDISSDSSFKIKNEINRLDKNSTHSDSDESELDVTTPVPWTCSQCQIIFKSAKLLEVHMREIHRQNDEAEPAVNTPTLVPLPAKMIVCSICRKPCANDEEFQKHLLTHAQPRPFVCEVCDAGFISMAHLSYHMTSYHQKFECDRCRLALPSAKLLHQHLSEAHPK